MSIASFRFWKNGRVSWPALSAGGAADAGHRPLPDEQPPSSHARRAFHGLSPRVKSLLVEGIKTIGKSGLTVLIVEQDASLALNLVERVYILEHGKLGLEGKSRDLMNNEEVKRVYFQLG